MIKNKSKKIFKNTLKIALLIVVVVIGSIFFESCSMIHSNKNINESEIVNHYYDSVDNYSYIFFHENKTGYVVSEDSKINFDWNYDLGVISCNYKEEIIDENGDFDFIEKKLRMIFIEKFVLYFQNQNMLFVKR